MQLRDAKSVKMEKENLLARVEAQAHELANHDSEALKAISLVKSQAFDAEQEKEELYSQYDRVSPKPQLYVPLAAPSYTSVIGRYACVRRRSRKKSGWRRTSSASTARTKSSPSKVTLGDSIKREGSSDTPPVVPAAALGRCSGARARS